ncbi:HipA family kinase [Larkinella sp. GY13]|uniref:HipA family kinase n=1 Tax=Larkinella sp. GY13 TaxID=3453720 RepID=UPI003EEDAC8B
MKILEAISYLGPIRSGGSTKPWVVQVNDQGALTPYVVKLFTEKQTQQLHPVAKEAFGNVLAQEFDLKVPTAALISFGKTFLKTLPEKEAGRLREVDSGLKFGTELKTHASIVDISDQRVFLKSYDIGTIFAFDNLVLNLDRGGQRNKPNLLIDDEDLVLIDHEQIFPFANGTSAVHDYVMPPFDRDGWYLPYEKHLFYPLLKQMNANEKEEVFDTFRYFLENLNVNALDEVANQLEVNDIEIGNYSVIKTHLSQTKARAGAFCKFLTTLIA